MSFCWKLDGSLVDLKCFTPCHNKNCIGDKNVVLNILFTRHPLVFLWLVSTWSTVEVHLNCFIISWKFTSKLIRDLGSLIYHDISLYDSRKNMWHSNCLIIYLPYVVTSECAIITELHPLNSTMADMKYQQMKERLRWDVNRLERWSIFDSDAMPMFFM